MEEEKESSLECKDCGNDTFRLYYGDYEIFATCAACGNKESVYQG